MTRARKWVSCACGYNWAWQRQVETGEDTHCSCCGRNWQKQLRKQQSSKEGKEGNSPRAVWDPDAGFLNVRHPRCNGRQQVATGPRSADPETTARPGYGAQMPLGLLSYPVFSNL